MFKKNDKTFILLRKIVNIALFVMMVASVITGVVLMLTSFQQVGNYYNSRIVFNEVTFFTGLGITVAGPVVCQLIWLLTDVAFNAMLDVKIIRDVTCGNEPSIKQLPYLFRTNANEDAGQSVGADLSKNKQYSELLKYKELYDQGAITESEYTFFKQQLMAIPAKKEEVKAEVASTAKVEKPIKK